MTPTLLNLEDEFTHLTLAPQLGGRIVNWSVRSTGLPLLRHSDAHALNTGLPGKLGCFPMAPWSNRISEGGFDCPEGWLALTFNSLTDPMPISPQRLATAVAGGLADASGQRASPARSSGVAIAGARRVSRARFQPALSLPQQLTQHCTQLAGFHRFVQQRCVESLQ